jgi:hypothetical protein
VLYSCLHCCIDNDFPHVKLARALRIRECLKPSLVSFINFLLLAKTANLVIRIDIYKNTP